jgi:hypothetical protein
MKGVANMNNKEYLNEERYQKNRKKVAIGALIVLILGLLIGGFLIAKGISNIKNANNTYTEENKQTKINNLNDQINTEKTNLETKKTELQSKGITSSSEYDSGEAYNLYIITKALDPSSQSCVWDEYKNNSLTSKYCSLKDQLKDAEGLNVEDEKEDKMFGSIPFFMIGAWVIIVSCMISSSIYMITKRREIMEFTVQQVMPVAQEGIDKMAPTVGKAAKEITKGIKDGMKDDKE